MQKLPLLYYLVIICTHHTSYAFISDEGTLDFLQGAATKSCLLLAKGKGQENKNQEVRLFQHPRYLINWIWIKIVDLVFIISFFAKAQVADFYILPIICI